MVSIPRADLEAMKAELRRLRREVGRSVAAGRIQAGPGPSDDAPTFFREELVEAWEWLSDRLVASLRHPGPGNFMIL
jgi:hypothetical protein